jgi:hypothetical protein
MTGARTIVVLAVIGIAGSNVTPAAGADVICIRKSGSARPFIVRPQCRASETAVGALATLQKLLGALSVEGEGSTLRLSGVNLQIVSGAGSTDAAPNGTGNVVVGYGESDGGGEEQSGSHNLVLGMNNEYRSWGGIVSGRSNELAAPNAAVLGGNGNRVRAPEAACIGGSFNDVSGRGAVSVGGADGFAAGEQSVVAGGSSNNAAGKQSVSLGGNGNDATGASATTTGGFQNRASGAASVVSGGADRTAGGEANWVAGALFQVD